MTNEANTNAARGFRLMAVLTLLAMLLVSCAGAPPADPGAVQDESAEAAVPAAPLPDDAVYGVLAGEFLGAEGDLQAAAEQYLEAALNSNDPAIAQRATRVAFAAEAWQQAVMAADRWARLAPGDVAARESAATAMLRVGDYLGAEYQLGQLLEALDDSGDAWLLASRILAQADEPEAAAEVMEQLAATRRAADPADVYFARSKLSLQGRRPEEAFEFARLAVERYPERMDFLTWAGRVALNVKLTPTAIEYLRRAWRQEPANHDVALAYADLLARDGQFDAARAVMRDMPQAPDVMLSRILFELAANQRVEAERLYETFGAADFGDPVTQAFYQAQAAEALGLYAQAIELYGAVTEGERRLAATLRQAELLGREGQVDAARMVLNRVRLSEDPQTVEQAWLTEASVLREAGRRQEAYEVLDLAAGQLPASIPLLYSRALLAAELKRVADAERDLRVIIDAQPENAAALNALGYTLADLTDRHDEAEGLIRRAYRLQPNEPSIIDSMGWVAYRQGRLEEAGRFLARAWELDRNPEIAAHLGEVLWVDGRREEALAVWREGVAADPDNAVLKETLGRLGVEL
jgi:tetratricopeptide (TPR) repeat protein